MAVWSFVWPHAARTLPSASVVKVWSMRGELIEPVAVHVPVLSEKSSADASRVDVRPLPPVTSTCPPVRVVAVCWYRAVVIEPVGVQMVNEGLKISAVAEAPTGMSLPAISTLPLGRRDAEWYRRATLIVPRGRPGAARGIVSLRGAARVAAGGETVPSDSSVAV